MAGRGRLYLIAAGVVLLAFIAGGAFIAGRRTHDDGAAATGGAALTPGGAAASDAASASGAAGTATQPAAAPAEGPAASAAAPATSRDWAAGTGTGAAADGTATSGAPATVLAEAVNQDPPVVVQVLSAKRITADTLRVELALVSRSAAPEALDLRKLAAAPISGGTTRAVASAGHPMSLTDLCVLTANGNRRLFALRDDQDKPVGAGDFAPLAPGERRIIWAVFPAPPAADTHATLLVGSVTLPNVPIS